MGMPGTVDWIRPILDFRTAHAKTNGAPPTSTFPRTTRTWELDIAEPAPYSTTRRKNAPLFLSIGGKNGESHTLHSQIAYSVRLPVT